MLHIQCLFKAVPLKRPYMRMIQMWLLYCCGLTHAGPIPTHFEQGTCTPGLFFSCNSTYTCADDTSRGISNGQSGRSLNAPKRRSALKLIPYLFDGQRRALPRAVRLMASHLRALCSVASTRSAHFLDRLWRGSVQTAFVPW